MSENILPPERRGQSHAPREQQRGQSRRHGRKATDGNHRIGAAFTQRGPGPAHLSENAEGSDEFPKPASAHHLLAGQSEEFEARVGDQARFQSPLGADEEHRVSLGCDDFTQGESGRDMPAGASSGNDPT